MRKEGERRSFLECELAHEDAMEEQHMDVTLEEIPCNKGKSILSDHVEELTKGSDEANHKMTGVLKRRSIRARKENTLHKGFVMG